MQERHNDPRDLIFILALALLGLLLYLFAINQATAQQRPLTPATALARLCISEANWECFETGDGYAIHEVISRGAAHQNVRYQTYARAYAGRLFGARPHDVPRLRWVGQLTSACTEPAAWPTTTTRRLRDGTVEVRPHAPWATFRERCLGVFERAAEVVAEMTIDDVDEWGICDRPVHDWGGWMDRERAARIGLVPVQCGVARVPTADINTRCADGLSGCNERWGTSNDFYCRPSLDPGCVAVDPN